jgi:hypothetical protein
MCVNVLGAKLVNIQEKYGIFARKIRKNDGKEGSCSPR